MSKTRTLTMVLGAAAGFAVARNYRGRFGYSFTDKVVLITGGSRGLGLCMARQLAREGARVAICARDADELDRARADLLRYGGSVATFQCDIRSQDEVQRMTATLASEFGPVDVLINNAGVIQVGPVEHMTLEDYEEVMRVHFWAPLFTTLAVLPDMRRRRTGRILNISSIGGKIAVPHLVPYCASKFALVGLSEGLRVELAKEGITVTTACPGLMRTGSPVHAEFKGRNDQEYAWFAIADSLPVTSISSESAARQVLEACRRGDSEVVISPQAKLAVKFHSLFPGATATLLAAVNRFLPKAGGIGARRATGFESRSDNAPAWLTTLSDRAARLNNEVPV